MKDMLIYHLLNNIKNGVWLSLYFIDFDFVIDNLKKHNKKWFDVSKLSSASRDRIYSAICEVSTRSKKDN